MGPLYPRMLGERFGKSTAVSAMLDAADGNASPELPAAAEELAQDVTLFGTYDGAGDTIASWFAAGADNLNLVCVLVRVVGVDDARIVGKLIREGKTRMPRGEEHV